MVGALDITQLVLAIPQAVDITVKTTRTLRKYRKINGEFRFSLERAEGLAYTLRAYVLIIQGSAFTADIRTHLGKALRSAHCYLQKLSKTLHAWKERLNLDDSEDYSSETSIVGKTYSDFWENESTQSCALRLRSVFHPVLLRINKVHYMILGSLSIRDALEKLDSVNKSLAEFVPISQHLSELSFGDEAAEFTSRAKSRNGLKITPLPLSLKLTPIEETDQSIFFKVTEGDFKECIVERRMVHVLNRSGHGGRALKETELITRMLCEEKQMPDGITTTRIGILRCCGYTLPNEDTHELIFRKPAGHTACTLRRLLITPGADMHRIDDRIEFALKLATAVHIFHSVGFVHKGIKPEAILVMRPVRNLTADFYDLGTPYLAGFNAARYDASESGLCSFDRSMNNRLYHDPRQLCESRPQKYQRCDDIFSLGIVMLELGLWRSLFRWDAQKKGYVIDDWADELFVEEYETEGQDEVDRTDEKRKEKLIRMAKVLLPTKMNNAFCDVVVTCLTFGDDKSGPAGERSGEHAGSTRFLSEVISELRRAKVGQRGT